jgi:hypothetical protein
MEVAWSKPCPMYVASDWAAKNVNDIPIVPVSKGCQLWWPKPLGQHAIVFTAWTEHKIWRALPATTWRLANNIAGGDGWKRRTTTCGTDSDRVACTLDSKVCFVLPVAFVDVRRAKWQLRTTCQRRSLVTSVPVGRRVIYSKMQHSKSRNHWSGEINCLELRCKVDEFYLGNEFPLTMDVFHVALVLLAGPFCKAR